MDKGKNVEKGDSTDRQMCSLIDLLLWTTTVGPFVFVIVTFVSHADLIGNTKVTEKVRVKKAMVKSSCCILPVRAAAVPLTALVATLHPLN